MVHIVYMCEGGNVIVNYYGHSFVFKVSSRQQERKHSSYPPPFLLLQVGFFLRHLIAPIAKSTKRHLPTSKHSSTEWSAQKLPVLHLCVPRHLRVFA